MSYKQELSNLIVRDKGDEGIIKEQSVWKPLIGKCIGGVALNLGAHIGAFEWWAFSNLKLDKIISVEPFPGSIDIWKQNWGNDNRCKLIEAAVVSDGSEQTQLYLGKTYSACNSLELFKGREHILVKCVDFKQLVTDIEPTLLKIDIEGGEYGLDWDCLPDSIKFICGEFHYHREHWVDKKDKICARLCEYGFKQLKEPKTNLFQKASIGVWQR